MSWTSCLENLKTKLSGEMWKDNIAGLKLIESNDFRAVVEVPPNRDIQRLTRSFKGLIEMSFEEVTGRLLEFEFRHPEENEISDFQPNFGSGPKMNLNEVFNFESFVVGHNSQFASSAALAVARDPGDTKYNPLLIYGPSGLGKTHLLQAIGNHIRKEFSEKVIRYVTADEFRDEYVQSLKDKKMPEFNSFYRNEVDVLLMDDIQFLSGKTETQNEFFHIFNALHQSGKQIVLTSDDPPQKVVGLVDRLISRFQWGLCVDVQPPDLETREAIIRKKAETDGLMLADDVILFLAKHIEDNVRVIEGAIRKLLLQADVENKDISVEMAHEVVASVGSTAQKKVNYDDLVSVVAEFYGVEPDKVLESGRGTKEVAQARQVAMYLMKELSSYSLKSIGKRFGDRDHSTVVHAVRTVEKNMTKDNLFKRGVEGLRIRLTE